MTEEMKRQYTALVDFLAGTLGPGYEIVLQDIDGASGEIIAIANNSLSGRKLGDALTGNAARLLESRVYEEHDSVLNYMSEAENGRTIRSSSLFIKDSAGTPVGLLCINFDSERFEAIGSELLRLVHPDSFINMVRSDAAKPAEDPLERFGESSDELMKNILNEVLSEFDTDPFSAGAADRQRLISALYGRGLFKIKGATQFVIDKLGFSQASVYRYLAKAKKEVLNL